MNHLAARKGARTRRNISTREGAFQVPCRPAVCSVQLAVVELSNRGWLVVARAKEEEARHTYYNCTHLHRGGGVGVIRASAGIMLLCQGREQLARSPMNTEWDIITLIAFLASELACRPRLTLPTTRALEFLPGGFDYQPEVVVRGSEFGGWMELVEGRFDWTNWEVYCACECMVRR